MKPFERNKIIKTMEDVNRLAERLSKCPEVSRFNNGQHKEGWALADSFADIEGEFREFLDEQLPKLTQAEGEELSGLLFEIGVAFQHIMYHIIREHDRECGVGTVHRTDSPCEPKRATCDGAS